MTGLRITDPDVADLPPSCKLVYLVLQEAGACSVQEIRARTYLADSTIRGALEQLHDRDLLEAWPEMDPRQDKYRLDRDSNE